MKILNMWGDSVAEQIRAEAPAAEIVNVGRADSFDPSVRGEVLFATWFQHPLFDDLDAHGVEWMHLPGTGIDAVPRRLLDGRLVTCSRGVSAIPISEYVLAAMLAFEKDFPAIWLEAPPEHWNLASLGELRDKTLALVGLGGIGIEVATRALAFGMRVRALRRNPGRGAMPGVELAADLDDLVADADHLVLAAPATTATEHLVDAGLLARVKRGVHIVNVARGKLVDQEALRAALDDGTVARATLDTVEPEPLPEGHWMYSHPGVRLSAHVSWSSPHAFERIVESFVQNLHRWVAGEPLVGIVDLTEGY